MDLERFKKSFVQNPMRQYNEHFQKAAFDISTEKKPLGESGMKKLSTGKTLHSNFSHLSHKDFTAAEHQEAANHHSDYSTRFSGAAKDLGAPTSNTPKPARESYKKLVSLGKHHNQQAKLHEQAATKLMNTK